MNGAWATSLDQIWRSPGFPMWLTLSAAGFFGLLVLVTLVRAEQSVANGALTVITLLAVGIAVAAMIRNYGPPDSHARPSISATYPSLPALSCLDDLAGDVVLSACEKAVFATPESVAAAVTYVASQIARLNAQGNAATVTLTPELQALRTAIERDRYGLVAQVLEVRNHCTPTRCDAFRSLTDNHQIITDMDDHRYQMLVVRYAPTWNAPGPITAPLVAPAAELPTGKPTNEDFPSAASTPAVSIMSPEPGTGNAALARRPPPPHPARRTASSTAEAKRDPKKETKKPRPQPRTVHQPTLLSPGSAAANN